MTDLFDHDHLRTESRDRNRFRNERKQAGDERFDVWLPADVAAWVRGLGNAEDRTANYQIRALLRGLYKSTVQDVEAGVNNSHRRAHDATDAWERLAP